MCGVVGVWEKRAAPDERLARLKTMTRALEHRGPDAEGFFFEGETEVALGHRRLSIVDLDPRSTQPMRSASGRFVIAFNGEIYNYRELALELRKSGVSLRTDSDTEVFLEWAERYGFESALEKSIGMFAIALYDREARTLSLARDRLGKKPLYYGFVAGEFAFASELGAFEAGFPGLLRPSREAFALLARFSFIPSPFSVYTGIRKLEPGTLVVFGEKDFETKNLPEPKRFWSLDRVILDGRDERGRVHDETSVLARVESLIADAVKLRMRADVPLGAFLSGGIDSSLIVAMMAEHAAQPVRTFSIGFANNEYDESKDAARMAKHLGTTHTEFIVAPKDVMALTTELATTYDEPFADSSALPTTLVSRLARKHVTVVLTGDGGDEVFAGYNRHIWGQRVWSAMEPFSFDFRAMLARLVSRVSPQRYTALLDSLNRILPAHLRVRSAGDKIHKLARVAGASDPEALHLLLASHFQDSDPLFRERTAVPALRSLELGSELGDLSSLERALRFDTLLGLPADMLVKVDRATMSVGLEARQPLLDHRLVELAWRLPSHFKHRQGVGKWVLREILSKRAPRALFERPKMGFGVPIGEWLRKDLRELAENFLDPVSLSKTGLFEPSFVRELWASHLRRDVNADSRIWIVMMAEAWLRSRRLSF